MFIVFLRQSQMNSNTMQKTIYFNDNALHLVNGHKDIKDSKLIGQIVHKELSDVDNLKNYVQKLQSGEINHIILETTDLDQVFESVKSLFTPIIAAGGVVKNEDNKILLIFRRGCWDLPKGKLDEGESIPECAVREVNEETGIDGIHLGDLICKTYHTYIERETPIFKTTYWYEMNVEGNPSLSPQAEEQIEKVIWVDRSDLTPYAENSYASIRAVLEVI